MVVLEKVNNIPNFDFKGRNSLDEKIFLTSKPTIPSPEMRLESVPVKGRDSSYTVTDGTYDDIEITVGLRTYRGAVSYESTLDRLNEFLRTGWNYSENEITFSEYPNWNFKVKYIKPYTWQYHSPTGELTTALTFVCDPFKYSETYTEVVGVTSTPVPMPPREFKIGQYSTYQIRNEQNVQTITDLAKFGYTRVLTTPNRTGVAKDYLRDIDGQSEFTHQTKYSSGDYKNYIDDFYSNNYTTQIPSTGVTWTIPSAKRIEMHSMTMERTYVRFTTVEPLTAGNMYYFNCAPDSVPFSLNITITNPNNVVVANVNKSSSVTFKADVYGTYKVEVSFNSIDLRLNMDGVRLHKYKDGNTMYVPARKSTSGIIITAFNMYDLIQNIEPNMITKSMTEAQMKTTLKARNIRGIYNAWAAHQTRTTFKAHQYNSATNQFNLLATAEVVGNPATQTFAHEEGNSFVDRLFYQGGNLWAIFALESGDDFDYPYDGSNGRFGYADKISLSLKADVQPSSSKDITNTGTADAFPYLKIYPQTGANTSKITFTGNDYAGRQVKDIVEIRNLNNVGTGQHIEMDCDFKDVIRYQENNPSASVPWTSWTIAPKFPSMKVGLNNITVENASKVEIQWRTRRI